MRAPADTRTIALGVLVPVLAFALAGVLGAAIWAWWADPPAKSEATPTNVELLLGRQFAVDASYAFIGLAVGLAVGALLALALRRTGWLLVVGVTLGGVAAAAVAYELGMRWGPSPAGSTKADELLSGALVVHVPGVFLSWPVGALAGLLLVVWLTDRAEDLAAEPALPDLPRGL